MVRSLWVGLGMSWSGSVGQGNRVWHGRLMLGVVGVGRVRKPRRVS